MPSAGTDYNGRYGGAQHIGEAARGIILRMIKSAADEDRQQMVEFALACGAIGLGEALDLEGEDPLDGANIMISRYQIGEADLQEVEEYFERHGLPWVWQG